jgi:hypothetical protein
VVCRNTGVAYLQFESQPTAGAALKSLEGRVTLDGKPFKLAWSKEGESPSSPAVPKLFVSKLADGVTKEEVEKAFAAFGAVEQVHNYMCYRSFQRKAFPFYRFFTRLFIINQHIAWVCCGSWSRCSSPVSTLGASTRGTMPL